MSSELKYSIAETFYSLKGEGLWTGTAMFFVRLSGCNLNCVWCDTDHGMTSFRTAKSLVEEALQHPSRRVVITGGEPTLQDLRPLQWEFKEARFKLHLETNGTGEINSYWDWVAVSPKTTRALIHQSTHNYADEVKFICGMEGWKEVMTQNFHLFRKAKKLLMPLAPGLPERNSLSQENINLSIETCKGNPDLQLCMQMHKVWGIK